MEITPLQIIGLVVLVLAAYFTPRLARRYFERLAQRQAELLRAQREAEERGEGAPKP
ncbi:MAG: hypothetical protein Q7T26_07540 [Dehalococcoidia bacterium]|nr:hypothetical protein [Dehalococcoidia bacterium]